MRGIYRRISVKIIYITCKERLLKYSDISIEFTCTGKSSMFPLISTIHQGLSCWKGSSHLNEASFLRSTKENAYYLCTVHELVTVLYAMRFHGLDAILHRPGTFCLDLTDVKRWRFSVYYRFVYSFPRCFQLTFFIKENFYSKIIG